MRALDRSVESPCEGDSPPESSDCGRAGPHQPPEGAPLARISAGAGIDVALKTRRGATESPALGGTGPGAGGPRNERSGPPCPSREMEGLSATAAAIVVAAAVAVRDGRGRALAMGVTRLPPRLRVAGGACCIS